MNNKEILDKAPEGATHIDGEGYLNANSNSWWSRKKSKWHSLCELDLQDDIHSLSDIKRIVELEEAIKWSRDNNTGYEPSVSVMHRYYDELIPKVNK